MERARLLELVALVEVAVEDGLRLADEMVALGAVDGVVERGDGEAGGFDARDEGLKGLARELEKSGLTKPAASALELLGRAGQVDTVHGDICEEGLVARALYPGRQAMGFLATALLGLAAATTLLADDAAVSPAAQSFTLGKLQLTDAGSGVGRFGNGR